MKLCYAAALVLVGWYVMCAPYKNVCWFSSSKDCVQPDNDAPLSHWKHAWYQAYDKAADCIAEAQETEKVGERMNKAQGIDDSSMCDCVASDDPRLKGN